MIARFFAIIAVLFLGLLNLLLFQKDKTAIATYADVTTSAATSVSTSSVTLNGVVENGGTYNVSANGFIYSTNAGFTSTTTETVSLDTNEEFIYAVSTDLGQVKKYDSTGAEVFSFGSYGISSSDYVFRDPRGVAVDADGNIYVVDLNEGGRVNKYNSSGTHIATLATNQGADFRDISFGPNGYLYYSIPNDNVIKVITTTGTVVETYSNGSFDYPFSLDFDYNGHMYVVSYAAHDVLKVSLATGSIVAFWDGDGSGSPGQLRYPQGVAYHDGNLYVSNTAGAGNRVQKFTGVDDGNLNYDSTILSSTEVTRLDAAEGDIYMTNFGSDQIISASGTIPTISLSQPDGLDWVVEYTTNMTKQVTGLTCNTTYYYKAYATNFIGTAYGDTVSFTTSACPNTAPTVSLGSSPVDRNWYDITSSSDGTKLAAVVNGGNIYTSSDSGATWTARTNAGSGNWYSITSSSDGTKLAAVAGSGYVYTSSDSGATWTARTVAGSNALTSITSSSDGTKLAASEWGEGVNSKYIYTSADSGVTWTQRTSAVSNNWYSITSSSDGTKLAAVVNGGNIYTSSDSGATWTARTDAGSRGWYDITSSTDGTKLAAVVNGGNIYTSSDSGATWTARTDAGSRNWQSITSSSDGTKLAAVVNGGNIYTSSDSGATWIARTNAGSRDWYSITSSSDGTKLAAVVNGGNIYTSSDSGATWAVEIEGAASSITTTGATLNGNITSTGGATVTDRGFVYGTTESYGATTTTSGSFGTGTYTASLSGLTCNTTYYINSFATNSVGTSYGRGTSFTTSACSAPTVTTSAASSVTATSAVLNGNITSIGGVNPTVRGFNYGTSQTYTATSSTSGSYSTGTYTATVTGLTCNTTYNFRAFAENTSGRGNGSNVTFTTSPCAPTVTTSAASSITTTGATLNGNITSTGGATVTDRGFVYGTTESYGATTTTSGSFGTGTYTASLSGLTCNTTYYINSFATNSVGTSAGSGTSFTTSACPSSPDPEEEEEPTPEPEADPNARPYSSTNIIGRDTNANGSGGTEGIIMWKVVPLSDTFPRELSFGMRGRDVQSLQIFLNTIGFILAEYGFGSKGMETEYFGNLTRSALSRYQSYFNLEATGVLDWNTIRYMRQE